MSHEYFLWIATLAYGLHIVEELLFDWKGWARGFLKLPAEWNEFYVFNGVVILYGCVSAIIGWKCPMIALSYPAFMLINVFFFHIFPVLKSKRFSPGLLSGIGLFIPIASLTYYGAGMDHVISSKVLIISTLFAAFVMAYPIIFQRLKIKAFFRQNWE
ncbi:MAG TPA: HXXEE domain-containing protein [Firmicutes bacterium]|jgi:hypothetical protein|nr:HXXEE domain-containing protein [Bacillota bacterium]